MTIQGQDELLARLSSYSKSFGTGQVSTGTFLSSTNQLQTAIENAANATSIKTADSSAIDAFGRWRVSNPVTLFDGRSGYSENLLWSDQLISGSLISSQDIPSAQTLFTTLANTAGRRVRQSLKRFNYTPGKSQLALMTFNFNGSADGNDKKVGYFDDRNGIFLRLNGSVLSLNRRKWNGIAAIDTTVAQANWNIDKLDGSGPSGITLDVTKTQIFLIDLEWLGVGRVRMGFVIDGQIVYCHEFNHANTETVVYMSTGNLPTRYELEHSGTGPGSSLSCICATVISEGGTEPIGAPGARFTGVVSGLSASTGYCLMALRLKAAQAFSPVVRISAIEVLGTTANDNFAWYLLRDPTPSIPFSYNSVDETSIELALGGGNITTSTFGPTIITGGVGRSQAVVTIDVGDDIQLETEADGTPIPLVLTVFPYNSMSLATSVKWRQFG